MGTVLPEQIYTSESIGLYPSLKGINAFIESSLHSITWVLQLRKVHFTLILGGSTSK